MKQIPDSHADILEKPAFAHLSTLMSDGSPQASAVWVDTDGPLIVVNSAEGRLKDRNIRRDPRVAAPIRFIKHFLRSFPGAVDELLG